MFWGVNRKLPCFFPTKNCAWCRSCWLPAGFLLASCLAPAWAPAWATPGLLLGYSRATVVHDIVKPCSLRSGRTSWRLAPRAWKVDEPQL